MNRSTTRTAPAAPNANGVGAASRLTVVARGAAATIVALMAVAVAASPALADGPGYGGTADKLAVNWVSGPSAQAAGTTSSAPSRTLRISGVGFRNLSTVSLRVSSNSTVKTSVDAAGTLDAAVLIPSNGPTLTGTSVVASGRAPSGTSLTLVGSVPPVPSGMSPALVVPWVAALLGLVFLGYRVATGKRRRTRANSHVNAHHVHETFEHSKELVVEVLGHTPHMPVPEPAG